MSLRRPLLFAVTAGLLALSGLTPALARAAAPVTLTGTRSWYALAETVASPMSTPPAPAGPSVDLPRSGCPHPGATRGGGGGAMGEGLVRLTMAGPGTDWSSPTNTSTVVDVRVDGGPVQEIVLFAGAAPFRYEGFVGPLAAGGHCVTVTVRPDLSHTTTVTPEVQVYAVGLAVVPADSADYLLESHTPVLYGRSTSALGDTPLIAYGEQSTDPDGVDQDLSYTIVWTHEDVGDGLVPAYEWGLWGRMTDIETVINEKVAPDGRVLSATYLSCGCENLPVYPDIAPEDPAQGGETYKPYPASGASPGLGSHLGIRDATGNNDISPYGTSAYRFQPALVTGPGPGQMREVAMDQNPWTYRISNDEVVRETAQSSNPDNFLAGQYPQYLIVDIDSHPTGTGSVSVAVQLDGKSWYSNDYAQMTAPGPATTFPFYNGGHGRTVIKLPADWHSSAITGLRLTLNAAGPGTVPSLGPAPAIQLIEVTPDFTIVHRSVPAPTVSTAVQIVPTQLGH